MQKDHRSGIKAMTRVTAVPWKVNSERVRWKKGRYEWAGLGFAEGSQEQAWRSCHGTGWSAVHLRLSCHKSLAIGLAELNWELSGSDLILGWSLAWAG